MSLPTSEKALVAASALAGMTRRASTRRLSDVAGPEANRDRRRVAVVGGGLAGITAAIDLARGRS